MSTYQRWHTTVRDQQGNAVNGASVYVYNMGTGTLAAIYDPNSNDTAPAGISNPFVTTTDGMFGFMAPDGEYDVVVAGGNIAQKNYRVALNAANLSIYSDLASTSDAAKGASLSGYNPALSYASGTVGSALNAQSSRPGNRIAVIGDSTVRGVYGSIDSEPGIGGTTVYVAGDSWITQAAALAGGKMVRSINGGVIGDTIAMMNARVATDIIAHPTHPTVCIVYSGYNDAAAAVSPSDFITTYASVVTKLRSAGIIPIAATCLPTVNNSAIAALMIKYSLNVRKYATDNGLMLLDFESWAMDSSTGGLTSAVGTGGDGVHPGAAGQRVLGQKVVDLLVPYLSLSTTSLQISPLDTANIAPNGLFTGTPVGGLAPNVFNFTSRSNTADSVVTDALVPGSMQRCTHTGSAGVRTVAQRINAAGKWSAGDILEFSGVVTNSGITAEVQIEWGVAPFNNKPVSLTQNTTRGYYCARIQIPAGIGASYFDVMMNSGPGTGTADFGQLTIRNLTVLGL